VRVRFRWFFGQIQASNEAHVLGRPPDGAPPRRLPLPRTRPVSHVTWPRRPPPSPVRACSGDCGRFAPRSRGFLKGPAAPWHACARHARKNVGAKYIGLGLRFVSECAAMWAARVARASARSQAAPMCPDALKALNSFLRASDAFSKGRHHCKDWFPYPPCDVRAPAPISALMAGWRAAQRSHGPCCAAHGGNLMLGVSGKEGG